MVICDTCNFTYVRIPKNASSSLAHFFVKNYCSQNDKYTEVNDAGIRSHNVPSSLINKYREQYRFIHLTMQELVDNNIITKDDLLKKENIGVIRNPFERQLSLFFFLQRQSNDKRPETFRKHFEKGFHYRDMSNHILQTDYLKVDGDDVGTWWVYENLHQYVQEFAKRKKVKIVTGGLQNFKSNMRPKGEIFDLYYDKKTENAVMEYYEQDFIKYNELVGGKK